MNLKLKTMSVTASTALATGLLVIGGTGTAHAATACAKGGNGNPFWRTCHNVVGATVYGGWMSDMAPGTDGEVYLNDPVGHLYSNPSWFECRIDNGPWNGGGPHPYRWLWTESDDGGWGWVADTDIYDETNDVLGCGEGV
jgi:hypothetical protein